MICGRCLHSEHIPCVKEVVDLLKEGITIDCERVNTMKSLLMEVKDEILLLKNEAEQSKDNYKKTADKCVQDCMELGNTIKRRVDELTSGIRDGIIDKHNENLTIHSHITKLCDEKTKWCDDEESKIDNFVDNNLAGHLYLMSRHFEKEASDARSHLKEMKHKHTFKGFDFKENNVILKCLFEDLDEVCEQQDEVTGSDDGNANDVFAFTPKVNKTRRELTVLLNQAKDELDNSEKTRKQFEQELLRAKQDIQKSENTRKQFEQDLLKAKQDIVNYEKTQKELRDELKRVKLDLSEKERAVVTSQLSSLKDNIKRTQPTGTVDVKISQGIFGFINLIFTFPDGIQTSHHPSPGNPIKGGTFTARLRRNSEGELLCRMFKAAFRKGVIFILGKEGKVVLDGVSLYDGSVNRLWESSYVKYTRTLKAELAAKGSTEADIDQKEKLEETFTLDGLSWLKSALS
ncbi:uncharacterized protein LOC128240324 isoform X2 [Mya arenaria]|uniref:uncharacterized protein LOC128240324 isoform X2 n=1 Tax=Mya arenaria TaxID=6604 RepID=UPI0022E05C23|nr:uncharacterized protein LOC128240324 isoform X2 [Mya arenaria]